jgi:hypothetical protein
VGWAGDGDSLHFVEQAKAKKNAENYVCVLLSVAKSKVFVYAQKKTAQGGLF